MMLIKVLFCVGLVVCLVEPAVIVNVYGEDDAALNTNLFHEVQARGCDNRACNQFCRRHFYASGACLPSGQCHCYKFKDTVESVDSVLPTLSKLTDDASKATDVDLSGCTTAACQQLCQSLGFFRGVCLSDSKCLCTGKSADYTSPATSLESDAFTENTEEIQLSGCTMPFCNQLCKRLGFASGVCLPNGKCHCYMFKDTAQSVKSILLAAAETATSDPEEIELRRGCSQPSCNEVCQLLGYKGGLCKSHKFFCIRNKDTSRSADNDYFYYQPTTATETEDSTNNVELKLLDCQMRSCEQSCQRLGFPGGACVNGRCKCDIIKL